MLSVLTCLTFYLPTESGEKVSLGLTVLLAFSVFMLLIAESMPATSEFIPLIGIYFTVVMSLTSLSVLLAVVLLNVHLYGSALKPVPSRLRRILFYHLAPFLRVKLHRGTKLDNQKHPQHSSVVTPRRATTIYNAVFLNENDLLSNGQQQRSQHTFQSTTISENNVNSDSSSTTNIQTQPQSLGECKRLLTELNRLILRPTETHEEEIIIRDWQNVALVIDRCLFFLYLFLTTLLTIGTLVLAPLLKNVPKPPKYHELNITRY
jgi:nicotinic acetylcholine receptor